MNNTRWEGSSFVSTYASSLSTTFYTPREYDGGAGNGDHYAGPNDDDITVATATTATKTDLIGQEMADHNICFEIPYHKGQANDADLKLHAQLLHIRGRSIPSVESIPGSF